MSQIDIHKNNDSGSSIIDQSNQLRIIHYSFYNHSYFFYSHPNPLAFKSSFIFYSDKVVPPMLSSIFRPIETSSIFFGEGVVVYIVFTKAFKANPYPSFKDISSLYSCFKNEFAAAWFVPIAVAFHPAQFPEGSVE